MLEEATPVLDQDKVAPAKLLVQKKRNVNWGVNWWKHKMPTRFPGKNSKNHQNIKESYWDFGGFSFYSAVSG